MRKEELVNRTNDDILKRAWNRDCFLRSEQGAAMLTIAQKAKTSSVIVLGDPQNNCSQNRPLMAKWQSKYTTRVFKHLLVLFTKVTKPNFKNDSAQFTEIQVSV